MNAYICITISHKNNFSTGSAKYILIDLLKDQFDQIREILTNDDRPSKDHCVKVFCAKGHLYGRWNKNIQEIIESCPSIINSSCKRGEDYYRNKYHYWYSQAQLDPEFHDQNEIDNAISMIDKINKQYDGVLLDW